MSEKWKRTSPDLAHDAGNLPNRNAYPVNYEKPDAEMPEKLTLQEISVSQASIEELLELKQFLDNQRINLRQKSLQSGRVSVGYEKRGVVIVDENIIGIRPNQNNILYTGTPQEFLEAIRSVDNSI